VPNRTTSGLMRIAPWSFAFVALAIAVFIYEHLRGHPRWGILGLVVLGAFALCAKEIRNLVRLKSNTTSERATLVLSLLGAGAMVGFILGVAHFYSPAYAMHLTGLYVFSSLAPVALVVALLALWVERKYKVRVYVGNTGWVFVGPETPSNTTPHADARDVPAPASDSGARAGGRER